jgi:hypothetical protein
MQVSVKLVVFKHPEWEPCCSYFPELEYFFGRGDSVEKCVECIKNNLLWELQNRFKLRKLKIRGWEVSKNSIIVPKFTDEEAVTLTEESYEIKIPEFQIVVINVEVPEVSD